MELTPDKLARRQFLCADVWYVQFEPPVDLCVFAFCVVFVRKWHSMSRVIHQFRTFFSTSIRFGRYWSTEIANVHRYYTYTLDTQSHWLTDFVHTTNANRTDIPLVAEETVISMAMEWNSIILWWYLCCVCVSVCIWKRLSQWATADSGALCN